MCNMSRVRVLIAGAGIAGLTAALSLHAAGIEARLVDSATTLRPLGVGINLLLAAVRDRLGEKAVQTGATVTGFTDRDGSVEVLLSDRSNGRVVPATADVLIGADGLYSAVRAQLHPDEPPPRWSGVMMWRGAAEGPPFRSGATLAITGSTSTVKFVAYPIAARGDGRALINWVAEV